MGIHPTACARPCLGSVFCPRMKPAYKRTGRVKRPSPLTMEKIMDSKPQPENHSLLNERTAARRADARERRRNHDGREISSPQKQPANVPRMKQPAKAARKRAASQATRKSSPQTCRESSNPQKQPANVPWCCSMIAKSTE